MTSRDKAIQAVCAAIIVVCLILSGALATQISAEAGRSQLVYTDQAAEGDPPSVAVGIAMGAFRGLFVNYLWLRATRLKEDGKFHEAIELSSAITKLQPRFPRVWAFHAWNMAYNISVATKTAEERWQWVRAGINLIRDEAIPMNPNDVHLHKELAWILVHKVQGYQDDANRYYKKQFAEEWTIALGSPPRLPEDTPGARATMLDWFRPIADSPNRLEAVIRQELAERRAALPMGVEESTITSDVEALARGIREEAGLDFDLELLRLLAYRDAFRNTWYAETDLIALPDSERNIYLEALIDAPAFEDAWKRLLPHIRKRVLIDTYHMEPRRMLSYMERYGPLDWRHPAAHAMYWATRGVELGLQRKGIDSTKTINTDRIVMQALQELWRSGTIFYDLVSDEYLVLQNLHYTDTYDEVFQVLSARGGTPEAKEKSFSLYRAGHGNFQKEVIRAYYRLGDKATALRYYEAYAKAEWRTTHDTELMLETMLPIDQFVMRQLEDDRLTIPYVFSTEVFGALTGAYIRGLLGNDATIFQAQWDYARQVHKIYFERHNLEEVAASGGAVRMEEMPRDFREVAGLVLRRLITSGNVGPAQASQIFQKSPTEFQKMVFDDVARSMSTRGMPRGIFEVMFPEPPGMEQYRQLRKALEDRDRGVIRDLDVEQQ